MKAIKVKDNYFDTHIYKISRNDKGSYQAYIRHKFWGVWTDVNTLTRNLPILNSDLETIIKKYQPKATTFSYTIEALCDGYPSKEQARSALNAYIHVINFIMHKNEDEDEAGSLKEFAVLENI